MCCPAFQLDNVLWCICVFFVVVQEEEFLAKQKEFLDKTVKEIINNNKREIAEMERECLNKKQELIRGRMDPYS